MVENWDGPPTGYDWKQFLASVRLVRLTKLDRRPWWSTDSGDQRFWFDLWRRQASTRSGRLTSGNTEMLLFSRLSSSSSRHLANDLGMADSLLYLRPKRFMLARLPETNNTG